MKLQTLFSTVPDWTPDRNTTDGVVLGCITRMVRNLPEHSFPGWSTAESRAAVATKLLPVIKSIKGLKTAYSAEITDLSYGERRALLTRKLITPCMAARQDGCHVILSPRRMLSIMLNEEEHLVVHNFQNGLNLNKSLSEQQRLDTMLQEQLRFAYTEQNGYLTSIPGEAGDGLQLYCFLHLPALTLANMMNQVTKAMEKLHVCISPYYSDSQDDTGHLFVLFSIPGPEDSIDELKENFLDVVDHLVRREQQVRRRLMADSGQYLQDAIARAYGLLNNCRRLSVKELRDATSLLRLGTLLHLIKWEEAEDAILVKLHHLNLAEAQQTALAADEDTPQLHVRRAQSVRNFLIQHPHQLLETPDEQ